MSALHTSDPVASQAAAPSAVAWINGRQALVATMSHDGRISTCEISRGWLSERSYLAQVVRVIGDRWRVVIVGPSLVRLALAREYVAVLKRPDRLVAVEPAGPIDTDGLIDRLRTLAS
jgi:hypothetical protein